MGKANKALIVLVIFLTLVVIFETLAFSTYVRNNPIEVKVTHEIKSDINLSNINFSDFKQPPSWIEDFKIQLEELNG